MDPQDEFLSEWEIADDDLAPLIELTEDEVNRREYEPVEPAWGWEPHIDASEFDFDNFIHYSDRADTDFVVSGPLRSGWGPGRWFPSRILALAWAREKYGEANVRLVKQVQGRWSFLVKGGAKCTESR